MEILKSISDYLTCDEIKQYYARQRSFFIGFSERKHSIDRIISEFDKLENMECMMKRIIPNLLELAAIGGYVAMQDSSYLMSGIGVGEIMRFASGRYFEYKRMGLKIQKSEILAAARRERINDKVYHMMEGIQDD